MIKILLFLLKKTFIIGVVVLVLGRIFFPAIVEHNVISPISKLPVVGKVLGTTWEQAGTIGPVITQKTIDFSDKVEYANIPISETVEDIARSENPGEAVTELIENSVNKKAQAIKNLPEEAVEKAKNEIRKEMYKQICSEWVKEGEKGVEN
jgi:hypothetical protein